MAQSTQAGISSYINPILEDALFVLRETTLMVNLVTPFRDDGYATRTIPIYTQATAQTVGETEDYSNAIEFDKSTAATFTPSEVMAQFLLTDRRVLTDPDNAMADASRELGMAVSQKIDRDLTGLFDNFSNGKGTAGSALIIGHVAAAIASVRTNFGQGQMNVVLHPYQWFQVWKLLGNPAANQAFLGDVANEALKQYFAGRFLEANWYSTANVVADASDDAYGAAFVRDALGFDSRQRFSIRPERDESARHTELNGHAGYAVGEIRDEHGAYILSDASTPTS